MAIDHKIIRNTENFRGLDKRSSDILRSREYASDMKNAVYRVSGAINKRKGFQSLPSSTYGFYGTTTFKDIDPSTGNIIDKGISIGENRAHYISMDTVSLEYTGTSTSITFDFKLDNAVGDYVFKIYEEGDEIFSQSITTMQTFANNLPADFTLTPGTYAPDSMSIMINTNVTSLVPNNPVDIKVVKDRPLTTPSNSVSIFNNTVAGNDDYKNATFAQLNNVLYISNGVDYIHKYDGNAVYRAGLPNVGTFSVTEDTHATHMGQGEYYYKIVFEYTDNKNNVITSQPSDPVSIDLQNSSHVHIDFSNFDATFFDGFDTSSVFDSSFPLKGAEPTKNTDAHWDYFTTKYAGEKRLRVKIYRTKSNAGLAGLFYLIADLPYNIDIDGTGEIYGVGEFEDNNNDTILENNIGVNPLLLLIDPIKRHDPPPKGAYITTFKNCLVVAGQSTNVNNVQYSLPFNANTGEIGSEYFPDDDNGFLVNSQFGEKITGIAPLRDLLYIFHKDSIHVLAGDISEPEGIPYTIDLLTNEGGLGCESHHSITEFNNSLVFLSKQGVYSINSSSALQEISSVINPVFNDKELVKKRAVTYNWTDNDLLMMIIPKEDSDNIPTSESLIVVYDYFRDAWLQWDNVIFSGGITSVDGEIFFREPYRYEYIDPISQQLVADTYSKLNKIQSNGTGSDYADHNQAINFEYDTNWESLGDPTIPKKFLRLKLHSFDTDGKFESSLFDLDIKIQKDYLNADLGSINFDFGKNSSAWGIGKWGYMNWGSIASKFAKSKLPTGKCKSLKIRFTNNTIDENVLITNYELEIAAPYGTEIKD